MFSPLPFRCGWPLMTLLIQPGLAVLAKSYLIQRALDLGFLLGMASIARIEAPKRYHVPK